MTQNAPGASLQETFDFHRGAHTPTSTPAIPSRYPPREFSQLGAAIADGNYAGGNATLSFSDQYTLTFKTMTQSQLTALPGEVYLA